MGHITLDKLSKEELADNKPNPLLFECTTLGSFGEIDAFVSHSWHDPSDDKWAGLQDWRNRFKESQGREPRIWFDKCCIDQLDIDASLMCLPVHLAACKKFVMMVGPTYTSRMWCVMEIFVFLAAVNDMSRLECIPIFEGSHDTQAGGKQAAQEAVLEVFREFTVSECKCFSSDTRDKLLSIIEAGIGTLDDFDALIRDIQFSFSPAKPRESGPKKTRRESLRQRTLSTISSTSARFTNHISRVKGPADTLDFAEQLKDPHALADQDSTSFRPKKVTLSATVQMYKMVNLYSFESEGSGMRERESSRERAGSQN